MTRTNLTAPSARTVRRLTRERLRAVVRDLVLDGEPLPAWHDDAACTGMSEDLFFPVAETGPAGAALVEQAKAVCAGCSVRTACLADTMTRESPSARYGVFGGLSAGDRTRLYADLRAYALTVDEAPETPGAVA